MFFKEGDEDFGIYECRATGGFLDIDTGYEVGSFNTVPVPSTSGTAEKLATKTE